MKKTGIILAAIAILIAAVFVMKDVIIKGMIESSVSSVTGLRLTMGSFKADLGKSVIDIKDLKLANPSGFGKTFMVDAPEVYIAYDLPAILRGKTHLKEMRLDLKEFLLMRAASGATNIDSLKSKLSSKASGSAKRPDPSTSSFLIDDLSLKIGRVSYKDLAFPSASRDMNLNINERFSNITDLQQVVGIIMARALVNTGIARLAKLDTADLQNIANNALQGALDNAISGAGLGSSVDTKKAAAAIKGVLDAFGSGKK